MLVAKPLYKARLSDTGGVIPCKHIIFSCQSSAGAILGEGLLEQPDLQLHSAARKWIGVITAFALYSTFFIEPQTFCSIMTCILSSKQPPCNFPFMMSGVAHPVAWQRACSVKHLEVCIRAFSAVLRRGKRTARLKDNFSPTFLGWIMERDTKKRTISRMFFALRLGCSILSLFQNSNPIWSTSTGSDNRSIVLLNSWNEFSDAAGSSG